MRASRDMVLQIQLAVGKTRSAGSLVRIIPLDLTKLKDQQAVLDWIRHPAVKAVYVAPPCGTASAARNIDIPAKSAKTVEVV